MPDYGALSGRKLDEQRPGARVAVDAHKKSPLDFVLWKQSSGDEPGWESPWGRGRPGWHIECSAMSAAYLGDVFDIHGGGIDLIFPHHENELAQSRCAHGTRAMANYWMHNEFVQIEDTKMSKSLGNFVTIRDLLADWPGEVLRLNMLKAHYRSPMDWTLKGLDESHRILWSWYDGLASLESPSDVSVDAIAALSDDLNTPQMIAELHGLHRSGKKQELRTALGFLGFSGNREYLHRNVFLHARTSIHVSGRGQLGATEASDQMRTRIEVGSKDEIEQLVSDRAAARARKDFKESDRIRDELAAMGVVLKDGKDADGNPTTTWEIAR
jgi:cysteinyl-tRNA synthetase